jgi:peptidylprolyl isomerase
MIYRYIYILLQLVLVYSINSNSNNNNINKVPIKYKDNIINNILLSNIKSLSLGLSINIISNNIKHVNAYDDIFKPLPTPDKGFQTKSGLKYFDFKEGNINVSPRYGQIISFHYTGYYQPSPDKPYELFDSSYLSPKQQPFLHKHGNGRICRGIDEGIHTMKVGGKRRVIIPKSIGYTDFRTGPKPIQPKYRKRLGDIIDLISADKGELIFDLELLLVANDENDQGYYEDVAISQDEVRQLVLKSLTESRPGEDP